MTDKELLELAAKAYGFGDKFDLMWTETEYPKNSGRHGAFWNGYGHGDTAQLWNPLTDDGDAFRLAVKLGCQIVVSPEIGITDCKIGDGDWCFGGEHHHPDPYAATRRAIVRAAAEIGRMK